MWGVKAASMRRHEITEALIADAARGSSSSAGASPASASGSPPACPAAARARRACSRSSSSEVADAPDRERGDPPAAARAGRDPGWVHHVADLDTGAVTTTVLDRPVAPLSRAERLAGLGHVLDPTVFGRPMYRLTPRQPYQASPEGWVEVMRPTYVAPGGTVLWWEPPRDFDVRTGAGTFGLYLPFSQTPEGRALASFSFSGSSFAGATGSLRFSMQLIPNPVYDPGRRGLRAPHRGPRVRAARSGRSTSR